MTTIRRLIDDDLVGLVGLVGLGTIHGPDRDVPRRSRTFVAVDSGRLIGAGTLLWSNRHPDLVAASIDVASSARRHGVGSGLLDILEAAADRPLVVNQPRTSEATSFLERSGYRVAVTSVTSRVLVDDALVALDALDPVTSGAARTETVVAADQMSDEITSLYEEIYAARHDWAGRYTPPSDVPWITFAGPVSKLDGAIQVAHRGGRLAAVASLHAGPFADGADAFLAPTSVLGGAFGDRVALLAGVLRACLDAGATGSVRSINVEVDSTYEDLAAVVASWPTTGSTTRDAWLRRES